MRRISLVGPASNNGPLSFEGKRSDNKPSGDAEIVPKQRSIGSFAFHMPVPKKQSNNDKISATNLGPTFRLKQSNGSECVDPEDNQLGDLQPRKLRRRNNNRYELV